MKRLLAGFVLAFAATSAAGSAAKLDAKLFGNVDKRGVITARVELTNNTNRPICFLAGEATVMMRASDGSILGNPPTVDFLQPFAVQVIWDGGLPQTFDLTVDGGKWIDGSTFITSDDAQRLSKVTLYFEAFDCVEFLANRGYPKKFIVKRDVSAVPEFEQ